MVLLNIQSSFLLEREPDDCYEWKYRCIIETIQVIKFIGIIADKLWISPPYHEKVYRGKIWLIVIVFAHR